MDVQTNGWTDQQIDGQCFSFILTEAIDKSEIDDFPTDFAFFTKAIPTDQATDQRTDGPIDGHTLL